MKQFIPKLLEFRNKCADDELDIPFLFHCGETLELGTDTDGNLFDSLLLKAKRISHGFALPNHRYIMKKMKERGICLEVCLISNEILGLTPRISGHPIYSLLANNVPCTMNSDNGTIFRYVVTPLYFSKCSFTKGGRSTLSHEFYQVMIGKSDMTLYGWRQLIEWSLEYSCMSEDEREEVYSHWSTKWQEFLEWVREEYGNSSSGTHGSEPVEVD